jgi:hypothetical protein
MLPHLSGNNLHGHLDADVAAPEKTLTEGTGDKAVTIDNPEYHRWWVQDQKVLSILLGSMDGDIASQLIGCKTAAAAWKAVHTMHALRAVPTSVIFVVSCRVPGRRSCPPQPTCTG